MTHDQPASRRRWAPRPIAGRVYDQAIGEGFSEAQAILIAGRIQALPKGSVASLMRPDLRNLPRASNLPDIEAAANRIADAVEAREVIAISADFDADGLTSASVVFKAMTDYFGMPRSHVQVVHSLRLKEGYGVSDKASERILALSPRPTLCISVDQGSADEPRIKKLADAGVSMVVTDHHHIPAEGPPASAVACVNPARKDSGFGDPYIAGCFVAWYTMVAVQKVLRERGHPVEPATRLYELLPLVSVGTSADCVSLGQSYANRWALQRGISMIASNGGPIWEAFAPIVKNQWTAFSIGMYVAPRLNASGRLGDATRSLNAILSESREDAAEWVERLSQLNTERREIQDRLASVAAPIVDAQVSSGAAAICVVFPDGGNHGVHGIVASRIVEQTGLPTVCWSDAGESADTPGMLSGSFRSIDGVSVKKVLDDIAAKMPDLGMKHGGHDFAAGAKIPAASIGRFSEAWNAGVRDITKGKPTQPRLYDGELPGPPSKALVEEIEALEPYGKGFPAPLFLATVDIKQVLDLGRDGKHVSIIGTVRNATGGQTEERMVWFSGVEKGGNRLAGRRGLIIELRRSDYRMGPGYDMVVVDVLS